MEGVDRGETDKIEGTTERECRKKQFGKVDSKKESKRQDRTDSSILEGAGRRREVLKRECNKK